MRVPKKRELAALWLLYRKGESLNLGEAIDVLRKDLCVNRKTALNIIKRLKKLGIAEVRVLENEIQIKLKDPLTLVKYIAEEYLELRKRRCKLKG